MSSNWCGHRDCCEWIPLPLEGRYRDCKDRHLLRCKILNEDLREVTNLDYRGKDEFGHPSDGCPFT